MTLEEMRTQCLNAIDHYGTEHQKRKAVEEMGELIVALAREQDGRADRATVAEEIADVWIMVEQLKIVYGTAAVNQIAERKLRRLRDRILEKQREDKSMANTAWRATKAVCPYYRRSNSLCITCATDENNKRELRHRMASEDHCRRWFGAYCSGAYDQCIFYAVIRNQEEANNDER